MSWNERQQTRRTIVIAVLFAVALTLQVQANPSRINTLEAGSAPTMQIQRKPQPTFAGVHQHKETTPAGIKGTVGGK